MTWVRRWAPWAATASLVAALVVTLGLVVLSRPSAAHPPTVVLPEQATGDDLAAAVAIADRYAAASLAADGGVMWDLTSAEGRHAVPRDVYARIVDACPGVFALAATQRVEMAGEGGRAEVASWTPPDRYGRVNLVRWWMVREPLGWRRVPSWSMQTWAGVPSDRVVASLRRAGSC